MNKKQWKIIEQVPPYFTLSYNDVDIVFNHITENGASWLLYMDESVVARLLKRSNEILNFDDFPERLK